jgi:hypothetical protein
VLHVPAAKATGFLVITVFANSPAGTNTIAIKKHPMTKDAVNNF